MSLVSKFFLSGNYEDQFQKDWFTIFLTLFFYFNFSKFQDIKQNSFDKYTAYP